MTVVELATCLVPAGPESLAPVEGFIMVCVTFYERGFGLPLHRFLCSLLWSYGLELHHLTPSGIRHMAAFTILCEAYNAIKPPLNPRSHFFWARRRHDSGEGAVSVGSVDISVHSGPGADSPFHSLTLHSGGRKLGSCKRMKLMHHYPCLLVAAISPITTRLVQANFPRLQHLLEIIRGLLQKGLTGEEILRTFLSRGVQPLCQ
jgi:hypothetical protein